MTPHPLNSQYLLPCPAEREACHHHSLADAVCQTAVCSGTIAQEGFGTETAAILAVSAADVKQLLPARETPDHTADAELEQGHLWDSGPVPGLDMWLQCGDVSSTHIWYEQ